MIPQDSIQQRMVGETMDGQEPRIRELVVTGIPQERVSEQIEEQIGNVPGVDDDDGQIAPNGMFRFAVHGGETSDGTEVRGTASSRSMMPGFMAWVWWKPGTINQGTGRDRMPVKTGHEAHEQGKFG